MSEYELLGAIEDAEELHREVVTKWRWIKWGIPAFVLVMTSGMITGGIGSVIGVDTGGLAAGIALPALMGMIGCVAWFNFATPRETHNGDMFDSRVIRPRESAKKVREARRRHVEYTMRSAA